MSIVNPCLRWFNTTYTGTTDQVIWVIKRSLLGSYTSVEEQLIRNLNLSNVITNGRISSDYIMDSSAFNFAPIKNQKLNN